MTTLAQLMIDRPAHYTELTKDDADMVHEARKVLIASLTSADPRLSAERFMFEDHPSIAVQDLLSSGQVDADMVINNARQVANPMWIEFYNPQEQVRLGYWLRTGLAFDNQRRTLVIMCAEHTTEHRGYLFGGIDMPPFPLASGFRLGGPEGARFRVLNADADLAEDLVQDAIRDLLNSMFLLSIPRVCELVDVVHAAKLQKRRAINRKAPLVSFRRVKLNIGHGGKRYATAPRDSDADPNREICHRALHRVIGHFRTYSAGREQPKISFVPQHWRGDPEFGVVLHQRDVQHKETDK